MPQLTCVLLVDDDQTTNYLNKLLIKRLGLTDKLIVALNGQEAIDLLVLHCREATVDCPVLILLDIKMPVMDGFAFLKAYGQLEGIDREAIIVLMLTTSLHPQDVERMQQLPIAGLINKPLSKQKLEDVLEKYFHKRLD